MAGVSAVLTVTNGNGQVSATLSLACDAYCSVFILLNIKLQHASPGFRAADRAINPSFHASNPNKVKVLMTLRFFLVLSTPNRLNLCHLPSSPDPFAFLNAAHGAFVKCNAVFSLMPSSAFGELCAKGGFAIWVWIVEE